MDGLDLITQRALIERQSGLTGAASEGERDDAAWDAFMALSPQHRDTALKRMQAVEAVATKRAAGFRQKAAVMAVAVETGIPVSTLWRFLERAGKAAKANWLPALAPRYKGDTTTHADPTDEAWKFFLGVIKESASNRPLRACCGETRRIATELGWLWPSFSTVRRRWRDLPADVRAALREGDEGIAATTPAQRRSVAHMQAMGRVNLDGRMADVFVRWEDGSVSRPIVIALQDVYSRKMLGWVYAKTEDADNTKRLLLQVISRYGVFDALTTDNGRGFTAEKITGGAHFRFRGRGRKNKERLPIKGVLEMLGVKIHFAKPGNGGGKPIERGFRDVATHIDTRWEFKHAYCGNRPGARPDGECVPVGIAEFREVYDREIAAHNAEPGRRTEICKGKLSFDEAFARSLRDRPARPLSEAQMRFFLYEQAALKPAAKTGAMPTDGFQWWAPEHRSTLLEHRSKGVLVLYDPESCGKPVMVLDHEGRQIIDALPCRKAGAFDSQADAKEYARETAKAKRKTKEAAKSLGIASRKQIAAYTKRYTPPADPSPPATDPTVIKPAFTAPTVKPSPAVVAAVSKAASMAGEGAFNTPAAPQEGAVPPGAATTISPAKFNEAIKERIRQVQQLDRRAG